MVNRDTWKANVFCPIFIVLTLLLESNTSTLAQEIPSTPQGQTVDNARAFEFYPRETGFGSFFDTRVSAGQSIEITVVLANIGTQPQDLRVAPIDAFTAENGGFASAEAGTPPSGVSLWLELPEEVHTIEAGKGVERTFAISVPEGTAPGQYLTGLAAEHAEAYSVEGTDFFNQKLRYVIPVLITVPGPVSTSFEVGEIALEERDDHWLVRIEIINTGDLLVRPEGEVVILDVEGNLLASIPVSMQSVYARDRTHLIVGTPGIEDVEKIEIRLGLSDVTSGVRVDYSIDEDISNLLVKNETSTGVAITSASVSPGPEATDVQFANVAATITNTGEPVAGAQLSFIASLNGQEVERFPISQSLSLPTGDTPINTRYIPATGWTSGRWTFELLLESVEPNGAAVVVARQQIEASISIP